MANSPDLQHSLDMLIGSPLLKAEQKNSIPVINIFAVDHSKKLGYISDLTVRFETYDEQPLDVDMEKKQIY